MRFTKKDAEKRTARLARQIELPQGYRFALSAYNPGDHMRYQVQIIQEKTMGEVTSFPRYGHYNSKDFQNYLEGFFDAIEDLPFTLRQINRER